MREMYSSASFPVSFQVHCPNVGSVGRSQSGHPILGPHDMASRIGIAISSYCSRIGCECHHPIGASIYRFHLP